ncbi:MAG TPA: aldose 1-epimerase [Acidimicrobiia bacterium]|nr:aldose 1-epimerase [Acidimicrobiia bacterium]
MLVLDAGPAQAVVDPEAGGRIVRLDVAGLPLIVPPEVDAHAHGIFPMAPWAGRVRDGAFEFGGDAYQLPINAAPHAIHGTVRDRRWDVDEYDRAHVAMSVDLGPTWPFAGSAVQRIELTADSLSLRMEVRAAEAEMPVTAGWHPWWSRDLGRGEELEVELHADRMYRRDAEGIPSGEILDIVPPPWDDCFTDLGVPVAVLRWSGAATVTIESDCACAVVFTEPAHAVCVEPQSGPPDAFNLDPQVVAPHAPLVVHMTVRWELDG